VFEATITKRHRKRCLKSGQSIVQVRYVVNYRDPRTGRRSQLFFKRHVDAVAQRNRLVATISSTPRPDNDHAEITVAHAIQRWLENRHGNVKENTWRGYCQIARYVVGPLVVGNRTERRKATILPDHAAGMQSIEMLGSKKVSSITTADIRAWHRTVVTHVSSFTANVARKCLRAALALAAEDYQLQIAPMPSQLGRGRAKVHKSILSPLQVAQLLRHAQQDHPKGIYYAFPFLTGVRPSEQLGLLWEDVDFAGDFIKIRRMQELNGVLTAYTKTTAGVREIPVCPLLRIMLLNWREICPSQPSQPFRIFPRLGSKREARWKRGGSLSYANFLSRYWKPAFESADLPYVTPHSARHAFISTLQRQGIEIGLVAKLAGHASAAVTLGHYTQAVRGGEAAMLALQQAFTTANDG
jgi:integrase